MGNNQSGNLGETRVIYTDDTVEKYVNDFCNQIQTMEPATAHNVSMTQYEELGKIDDMLNRIKECIKNKREELSPTLTAETDQVATETVATETDQVAPAETDQVATETVATETVPTETPGASSFGRRYRRRSGKVKRKPRKKAKKRKSKVKL